MNRLEKLLINETAKKAARSFLVTPSHALMIVGSEGNGSKKLAEAMAAELTNSGSEEDQSPHLMKIHPNKHDNISIEEVRSIWTFAKVPTGDEKKSSKCVVIFDANAMTLEAQNSLLKLLEEPPAYMYFILTAPSRMSILPTIDSRSQKLELRPLSRKQFIESLGESDAKIAERMYLATNGEIYTALGLLKGGQTALGNAKNMLAMKPFARLSNAGKALSERDMALKLANDIFHLAYIGLNQAINSGKTGKKWLEVAKLTDEVIDNLKYNGNVKLNMTYLLTSI